MGDDVAAVSDSLGHEVMAAIDSDGQGPHLVIADICVEGSWLSIPVGAATCLADWR